MVLHGLLFKDVSFKGTINNDGAFYPERPLFHKKTVTIHDKRNIAGSTRLLLAIDCIVYYLSLKLNHMEQILKIEEIEEKNGYSNCAGYAITTNRQVVKMLIDNESCCCESWGYFMSEDNPQEFVGSSLINVTKTDTALNTKKVEEVGDLDSGGILFVNIETSKGLLQFVAHNAHNGYYGHSAYIISEQLTIEETL